MAIQIVANQIAANAIETAKIANSAVTAAKINLTGTFNFGSGTLQSASPTNATDVANKSYVDAVAQGMHWKDSAKAASTGNLTLSGTQTVDGVALSADDRILVKNQSSSAENGIYEVKAGAWARADDMDAADEFPGAALFVRGGTVNADTGWVCTNDTNPTVGSTAIAFAQFSGAGSIVAGNGLSKSGNTLSIDLKDSGSGLSFDSGELEIDALGVTNAMLAGSIANGKLANSSISIGGVSFSLGDTDGTPALNLSDASSYPTSALVGTISNAQLAGSIANSKLANSAITVSDGSNTTAVALGGTVTYAAGEGLDVAESSGTVTFSAEDAAAGSGSGNKGVASFDSADFAASSGHITIKSGGVSNSQLASSAVVIGSTSVSLGATVTAFAGLTGLDFTDADQTIGGSMAADKDLTLGGGCDVIITGDIKVNGNKIVDSGSNDVFAFDGSGNAQVENALAVNTIAEKTAANGVSVDSVLLKDGGVQLGTGGTVIFEGSSANTNELTLTVTDPTGDRTITLPDETGTVITSGSSAAVSTQMCAFQPRKDQFTGNGSATTFNLGTRILDANWADGVIVARNGQILKQVGSSPADDSEYTCIDSDGSTTLTFGAAVGSGQLIDVSYFA